jgi:hypothetical protein
MAVNPDPFIAGFIVGVMMETAALIVCLALCAAAAAGDAAEARPAVRSDDGEQ